MKQVAYVIPKFPPTISIQLQSRFQLPAQANHTTDSLQPRYLNFPIQSSRVYRVIIVWFRRWMSLLTIPWSPISSNICRLYFSPSVRNSLIPNRPLDETKSIVPCNTGLDSTPGTSPSPFGCPGRRDLEKSSVLKYCVTWMLISQVSLPEILSGVCNRAL